MSEVGKVRFARIKEDLISLCVGFPDDLTVGDDGFDKMAYDFSLRLKAISGHLDQLIEERS